MLETGQDSASRFFKLYKNWTWIDVQNNEIFKWTTKNKNKKNLLNGCDDEGKEWGTKAIKNKPERANRCVRNGSEYDHNLFPNLFGVFRRFFTIVNGHTDGRTYGHTDEQTFL